MINIADIMDRNNVAGVHVTEGRYLVLGGLRQHLGGPTDYDICRESNGSKFLWIAKFKMSIFQCAKDDFKMEKETKRNKKENNKTMRQ